MAGADGGVTGANAATTGSRRLSLDRVLLPPGRLASAVMLAVLALGVVVILSWLVTAVAHVDDGYAVDHVSGSWMALAAYAGSGTLYPPLYDGDVFGGTRFMPVPILLLAGAASVLQDDLVSAKILSYLLAGALVVLTFVLLRRRCPLPVALLLASTILVTGTGLTAATSVRNDVLPVILQLGAVALVARSQTRANTVASGLLSALAVVSKLSAVWAPLAIGIWLLSNRDRRRLAEFVTVFLAGAGLALGAFQAASGGRMTENVLGLSVATAGRLGSLPDEVARLRLIGREGLGPLAVLIVLAILGTLLAAKRRQLTPYHLAFACASLVTAIVLVDPGAFVNHLIDVQVLSVIVVGELWRRTASPSGGLSLVSAATLAVLVACTAATYRQNVDLGRDLDVLVHGTASEDRVPRLAGSVSADDSILSEDPFVSVSRGERPIVLDPFMLLSIAERHPEWRSDLVRRIENADFDKIVLLYQPHSAPLWYRRLHFGEVVVRAIERTYRPVARVEGYWIYEPK
ncbi:MAG: hypothetical protein ACRDQT_07140 [Gaiellaceae bacterium]